MTYYCFKQDCKLEAEYICLCSSFETCCCEFHLEAHLKLPYRPHSFDALLLKPLEWTKEAIFSFLTKQKSKKDKLKKIVVAVLINNAGNSKERFKESLKKIDSDLEEINSLIDKICRVPEQTQILSTLHSHPNDERVKTIIKKDSELYNDIKLFYRLNKLKYSTSKILNRANNDSETEQYFRKICKKYENYTSNPLLNQAYKDFLSAYQNLTSHWLISEGYNKTNLLIYNTEIEIERKETLKIPAKLDNSTCIAQLPNGEQLYFGGFKRSGTAFIIDKNYESRILPSGIAVSYSRAIYFNRSVYCFGGLSAKAIYVANVRRFDLDENRWIILNPLPKAESYCNIIIYKRNILISQVENNILEYSIDIDSFSTIPYKFSEKKEKILINAEERLYLIECKNGYIYESEAEDEYSWTKISKSTINNYQTQIYFLYNKRNIYIAAYGNDDRQYFKFDLDKKVLIETAYYNNSLTLRKVCDKLEEIIIWNQNFKVDYDKYTAYINKGYSLYDLGKKLINLQIIKTKIEDFPKRNRDNYIKLGFAWHDIDNHKAIKYFNIALELNPNNCFAYFGKGYALHEQAKYSEALECFNEAIKLNPNDFIYHCYRASLLNDIGKEAESLKGLKNAYGLLTLAFDFFLYGEILVEDCLELSNLLCELNMSFVEFKWELQKIKELSKENGEIIELIEEKVTEYRTQHSSLLKRAVRCLDSTNNKSVGEMEHLKNDINECQEAVRDAIARLLCLASIQK